MLAASARLGMAEPEAALRRMDSLLAATPGIFEVIAKIVEAAEQDATELLLPLDQVRLLSPVPIPNSLRDCMAFERHLVQCMQTVAKWKFPPVHWCDRWVRRILGCGLLRPPNVWHQRPLYYKGNRRTVVGTGADVSWPAYSKRFDFELEFGVFIGRGGRDIPLDSARAHIGGYALFNDFSARDVQLKEMAGRLGPAKGKDFDTGNAIGPWLVSPDVINERELSFEARVNGETWCQTNARTMKYSFAEIIAYASQAETLYPGDFIGSGTLPNGCGLELDRWLCPGDVVELDGGPLGVLRNRVVNPSFRTKQARA